MQFLLKHNAKGRFRQLGTEAGNCNTPSWADRIMLDYRQRKYVYRLLTLTDGLPIKGLLPITLRARDGSAQLGEQQKHDGIWFNGRKVRNYGSISCPIGVCLGIDHAEGVEPVINLKQTEFPGESIIQGSRTAVQSAQKDKSDLL